METLAYFAIWLAVVLIASGIRVIARWIGRRVFPADYADPFAPQAPAAGQPSDEEPTR